MTSNNPNDQDNPDDLDMDFNDAELLDQDDLGEYDDAENLDEEWEEPAQAAPKKKKLPLFNIIIIGIAVLIGVGILFVMGRGDSNTSPEANIPSQQASTPPTELQQTPDPNSLAGMQDSDLPPQEQPTVPEQTSAQGFMNDPAQLNQDQSPSLPSQGPSMTRFADPAQAPGATPPSELPVPTANNNLPNIDQIKKAAPVIENTTASTPVAIEPAPEQSAPAETPVISAEQNSNLMNKLDQVMTRLDSLEKKLAAQPTSPASSSTNSGEIASLRVAVERLENKVAKLSDAPVVHASTSSSFNDEMPSKVIVKKAVPKKKAQPKKSPPISKWELRSARPGEAMIGKPGQAELKTIRIGDSIVGIGEIQSISQMSGSWVVQGTSGRISQ